MVDALPGAETSIEATAGANASGVELCAVIACCALQADAKPRLYANADEIVTEHLYCPGADYSGIHIDEADKPILFVPIPIATPGTVGRFNTSGNTGTSVASVAVGPYGALDETDGVVKVTKGGTIGTDQIELEVSFDGGRTMKPVRLGTAASYTNPYFGLVLSFAAGTLVAGDTVLTWHSTAPRWDQAGLAAARAALKEQQKHTRTWLLIGDLAVEDDATDFVTELNAYETADERFVVGRAQVRDRLPAASLSKSQARMTGNPSLTFAEVGGTGDTVTRATGSWVGDGFVVGDWVTITGSASNNVSGKVTTVTATVLTFDTTDLTAEGPVQGVTVVSAPRLTFAEVGATGDTIARSRGSWLDDGFRVGDRITVAGTASNNFSNALVTGVTATTLTLDTQDLTAEELSSFAVTLTAGETKAQWRTSIDAAFADVDAEPRIDLGAGRGRKLSLITGYRLRRPVQWAASIREYQHDVHIPVWRKDLGPLPGWDLEDEDGLLVEHDERVDGGLIAARFTCFRTWGNGPGGTFIAKSLTRESKGSLLCQTHNMHVANIACSTSQFAAENAVGLDLDLNDDGTATAASLKKIQSAVNSQLEIELLQDKGEGRRASKVTWIPSATDKLNVDDAELNAHVALQLKGTLVRLKTKVRVGTAA